MSMTDYPTDCPIVCQSLIPAVRVPAALIATVLAVVGDRQAVGVGERLCWFSSVPECFN